MTAMKLVEKLVRYRGYAGAELVGEIYRPESGASYPGIVFCHGLCSSRQEFKAFARDLSSRGIIVMVFDYSGHGQSGGKRHLFTRDSHRYDTRESLDVLAGESPASVTVLGHSFGVKAALDAAAECGDVDKVILVGPRLRSGSGLRGIRRFMFNMTSTVYRTMPFLPDVYVRSSGESCERINLRTLEYAATIDNELVAGMVRKPCLVVAGSLDRDVEWRESYQLFEKVSSNHKEWLLLERAGHSPFSGDDCEQLLGKLQNFLA